jgi:hypothetical protein
MKNYIACLILLTITFGTSAKDDVSRYSYCSIFEVDFCIGLARGDKITVSKPIDFKYYDIVLKNGASLSMYYGRHPNPILESSKLSSNFKTETIHVQVFEQNEEEFRILVQFLGSSFSAIDIEFQRPKEPQIEMLHQFLNSFKTCTGDFYSRSCSQKGLFEVKKELLVKK